MKDKIPIEKVYLAYHYEATFMQALRRSAEEHGYKGLWGMIRFWTVKTIDYILQMAAYFAPYTGIRVWLHRLRGVKIGRNVHIGPLEQGNVVVGSHLGIDTRDTLVFGRSGDGKRLIATIGLEGVVIVDTEDALLICSRGREQEVRAIVRELEARGETDYL